MVGETLDRTGVARAVGDWILKRGGTDETRLLVVSEELKVAGYAGFGFLSFTLVGVAVLAVGVAYILLVGRRLLPGEARGATRARAGRYYLALVKPIPLAGISLGLDLLYGLLLIVRPIIEARYGIYTALGGLATHEHLLLACA